MKDARETIAQTVASTRAVDYDTVLPCDYDTADTILAAMPEIVGAMVKPLVWEWSIDNPHQHAVTNVGTYFICYDSDDFTGYYLEFITFKDVTWFGTVKARTVLITDRHHDDDIDPLKAAANDHRRAQVLGDLGL